MKKLVLAFSALLLMSCSHISLPTNYYVIDISNKSEKIIESKLQEGKGPVFAILPVNIPAYLSRPQIVLRESGSKIFIAENHRWGESLDKAIGRVLANSLTEKLVPINGVAVPVKLGLHPDYSIQLEITRFEGNIRENLEMDAFWTLQHNGEKILQGSFYNKVEVGKNYSELVQAYGDILFLLANDIANAIIKYDLKKHEEE